jgi:hypothetical protein
MSASAQNLKVEYSKQIADGERLAENVRQVVRLYLPGATGDWTIQLIDHKTFLREESKVSDKFLEGRAFFPPRCHTFSAKRITQCDAGWAREFSQAAKAGTLAHEYGHILCNGPNQGEACADRRAIEVLRPHL